MLPSPRFALLALLAATLSLPAASSAATVVIGEAGYVAIDGVYYVFDLPRQDTQRVPAELHPLGLDGFYLRSLLAMGECSAGDDGAGGLPISTAGLHHAEAAGPGNARRLDLRVEFDALASITLATCDGAVVMFASSASGNTQCAGAVGFPFRRGQCRGLDAADPGHVFFNAFEP
jgi:hypothetical protein